MEKFFALSEEKQKKVVNAALQCFGRYGYEKASVKDIAETAHISKASVFQYFGSKKQMYVYLLGYCGNVVKASFDKAALNEETDLFDRILASSRMKMKSLKNQPYVTQFITSVWEETSPEVQDELSAMKGEADAFRNDLVLREDDTVKFKNPADAEPVFQMLLLMAEGYAARYRNAGTFAFDTVMEDFEKNVEVLRKNLYKAEYL